MISSRLALDLQRRLRQDVFDHIIRQDMYFFAQNATGTLIARLTNDIGKIQRMLLLFSESNLRNFIQMIALLCVLIYLSPRLTFYAFLTMPFGAVLYIWTGKTLRKFGAREDITEAGIFIVLQEAFSGIGVIKAFAGEKWESNRFRKAVDIAFERLLGIRKVEGFVHSVSEFINTLAVVIVLLVGARLFLGESAIFEKNFNTASFFVYLFVITQFYMPMRNLGKMNTTLQRALAACKRINTIMEQKRQIEEAPDAVDMPAFAPAVRFENIHFHYPTKTQDVVLRGLDIAVQPGEVVALVGRSGAGKTSIINLLCRFYDPQEGRITIDDVELNKIRLESLRQKVAVVPQETFLFDDTVRNNICYAYPDATDAEVEEAARVAKAHEFIVKLPEGYNTLIGERGNSLSTGQKQRLAIARALIRKPTVLIFDEATASLDAETERYIQENLRTMAQGRTTFIIAHRFSTVTVADRIMVVDHGRIVEEGAHRELYEANGLYTVLCKCQEIF
jgi:ABC-type multidrug transport system fused ATPase/permease subunit